MDRIHVTFVSPDYAEMDAEVESTNTPAQIVASLIDEKFILPISSLDNLYYCLSVIGKTMLEEGRTLADSKVESGDRIRVSVVQRGGGGHVLPRASFSAPVRIPERRELTVDLVPIDYIDRLEEYRADQTRWETIAGIFAGGYSESLSIGPLSYPLLSQAHQ